MGSRAVLVLTSGADAAARTFGADDGRTGAVYSRNGRAFFSDRDMERRIVDRASGIFGDLGADWIVLDAEILPWSYKAAGLIEDIYDPTHLAASASAEAFLSVSSGVRDPAVEALASRIREMGISARSMAATIAAFSRTPDTDEPVRIASFHFMAASSGVLWELGHDWHMETALCLSSADDLFVSTVWRMFDGRDPHEVDEVVARWEEMTRNGGEGIVLKPRAFVPLPEHARRQPAVKVRGREYLRLFYGPDYDAPGNLCRLRDRNASRKQRMASSQFVLGLEGLSRLVAAQPLRRIHECVHASFGVNAETVDPRL